jgi:hypothetical protein
MQTAFIFAMVELRFDLEKLYISADPQSLFPLSHFAPWRQTGGVDGRLKLLKAPGQMSGQGSHG